MSKQCVLLLVLLCLCAGSTGDPGGFKCEEVVRAPTCVCRTPQGIIDLTKIASFNGTPRYNNMVHIHVMELK